MSTRSIRLARFSAPLVAMLVLCMLVVLPGTAYALACGDTITADTTLQTNLGPCSGTALTIGASNITLDLNGFSIIGASDGVFGVGLTTVSNVTITGPGTITGFNLGVAPLGGVETVTGTTVTHVHFVANSSIAVLAGKNWSVLNNTFINNRCFAVKIDTGGLGGALISGNAITGSNAPPVPRSFGTSCHDQQPPTGGGTGIGVLNSPGSVITQNTITHSTNGLFVDGYSTPVTVTGNDFSGNSQDGLAALSTATITGNQVNGNGRDGISIAGGNGFTVNSDTANSNGRRGIGLGDLLGNPAGSDNSITSNLALGNATDLFWDGNGSGNCWSNNTYDTSSPGILPACQ